VAAIDSVLSSLKDLVAFLKIKAGAPDVLTFPFALMKDNPVRSAPNQRHEPFNPTSVTNPLWRDDNGPRSS
jgi:hypothetical protein